jgi:uncharacterized membrane protein YhhN
MRTSAMFYLIIAAIAVLGAAGDIWLYRGARAGSSLQLALGLASWLVSLLMFAGLVRSSDCTLSVAFVLSAAIHVAVVVGFDFLMESPSLTLFERLGVVITIVGILCIEFGHNCSSGEAKAHRPVAASATPTP